MSCIMTPMENKYIPCGFDVAAMEAQQKILAKMIEAKNEVVDNEIKKLLSSDGYTGSFTKRRLRKFGYTIECKYNSVDRTETFKLFKNGSFIGGFYFDQNDIGFNASKINNP